MKLADRSPGLLMVLAAVVVYTQILLEIWMWSSESLALVFLMLGTGIAIAIGIMTWFHHLVSGGEDEPYADEPVTAPVAVRDTPAKPARGVTALPI